MTKIKDLDGVIGEKITGLSFMDEPVLVYEEKDTRIYRDSSYLYIKDLGVDIYSAYICNYEPETCDYEIDCDLYIFYSHNTDTEIYSEGGSSLPVCISNFCTITDKDKNYTMEDIENLDFEFYINCEKVDFSKID